MNLFEIFLAGKSASINDIKPRWFISKDRGMFRLVWHDPQFYVPCIACMHMHMLDTPSIARKLVTNPAYKAMVRMLLTAAPAYSISKFHSESYNTLVEMISQDYELLIAMDLGMDVSSLECYDTASLDDVNRATR